MGGGGGQELNGRDEGRKGGEKGIKREARGEGEEEKRQHGVESWSA